MVVPAQQQQQPWSSLAEVGVAPGGNGGSSMLPRGTAAVPPVPVAAAAAAPLGFAGSMMVPVGAAGVGELMGVGYPVSVAGLVPRAPGLVPLAWSHSWAPGAPVDFGLQLPPPRSPGSLPAMPGGTPMMFGPVLPGPRPTSLPFSYSQGELCAHWPMDARKLRSKDKQAVSPTFDHEALEAVIGEDYLQAIDRLPRGPFKIMAEGNGRQSFKDADGRMILTVKIEDPEPGVVTFWFVIGSGNTQQGPCQPFTNDFAAFPVPDEPRAMVWDGAAAAGDSKILDVTLVISLS
jgi:hypothetical protein